MSKTSLILITAFLLSICSCISPKRLNYLQANEQSKNSIDSILQLRRLPAPYRVQINDLLSVRVKALDQEVVGMFNPVSNANSNATTEEQAYFDGFLVDRRGEIDIPTLGKVRVIGLTLDEIKAKIKDQLLQEFFKKEANIFITVKLAGLRYTTIGEIGTGSQVIYKEQVTIMEAIANAGNITTYGDRQNVRILRQYPGGQQMLNVDLTDISALSTEEYYIKPNDVIIVDTLPEKSIGLGENAFAIFTSLLGVVTSISILLIRL